MSDHTKLRAFELADEVALLVYRITARLPKNELFWFSSAFSLYTWAVT